MTPENYIFPSFLVNYLMSGVTDNLTPEEIAAADRCVRKIGCGDAVSCAPCGFTRFHDFTEIPFAAECHEVTFYRDNNGVAGNS